MTTQIKKPKAGLAVEGTPSPIALKGEVYLLKVLLLSGCGDDFRRKNVYRVIAIRPRQSLLNLHNAIFSSFEREDEHLWLFSIGKPHREGTKSYAIYPDEHDLPARGMKVEQIPWSKARGNVFYLFDYGDDWVHEITFLGTAPAEARTRYPKVVESHGAAPPQYDYGDEDDLEGEEEDGGK